MTNLNQNFDKYTGSQCCSVILLYFVLSLLGMCKIFCNVTQGVQEGTSQQLKSLLLYMITCLSEQGLQGIEILLLRHISDGGEVLNLVTICL